MHPTTPFNTGSWTVRASELAGWLLLAAFVYFRRWAGEAAVAHIALVTVWISYAFIRFCSLVRWHRGARRGEGLEQQFIQVGVAAIYGFVIANAAALAHVGILIYPVAIILAGVAAINATLIYIFSRDRSLVPVNFYSHHKVPEEES